MGVSGILWNLQAEVQGDHSLNCALSPPANLPCAPEKNRLTMNPEQIAELIRAALPGADVRVKSEDNVHFEATVVSPEFAGKRLLQRHQLVYKALGDRMGGEIHALAIDTLTPDELATRSH